MIRDLTTSLTAAEANGWIDKETAVKAFSFALAFIGYEFDPDAIEEKVNEDQVDEAHKDYLEKSPQGGGKGK